MRKLFIGAILAVTSVTAQAEINVESYCNNYAFATAGTYNLKEQGYDKDYVLKRLIKESGNKTLATEIVNLAYGIETGLTYKTVFSVTKSSCIKVLTKRLAK